MIPKTSTQTNFLTVEQAESIIDATIRATREQRSSDALHINLMPITEDVLARVAERYVAGRWSVSTDSLRTPHAYRITLS